jgi:hypothetical protein
VNAAGEHARDRIRLGELQQQLRNCAARIDENAGTEAADTSAVERRIELNQTVVDAARSYVTTKAAWEKEQEELAEQRENHETWDKIATALKPDGIEADLLDLVLPEFLNLVNEITVEMGVGTVSFTGELAILVERPWGKVMVVPQLSRSARHRLGIGIQHAIARLTGFPILIVDELDIYNPKLLPAVMTTLLKVAKDYRVGVLGFATLKVGVPVKPEIDDLAMWLLKDGALQAVA